MGEFWIAIINTNPIETLKRKQPRLFYYKNLIEKKKKILTSK